MEDLMPWNNLLEEIKAGIDFDFIYKEVESYYSQTGMVSGETAVSNGSFVTANVSWYIKVEITRLV
jgi:hypothetical protein